MIVADTSVLIAYVNLADPNYPSARRVFEHAPQAVTSPLVMAEFDYLLRARLGGVAARSALRAVLSGGLHVAEIHESDLLKAVDVDERFSDLDVGVTDGTLVVLAERFETRDIATFDQRHFRTLRPAQGGAFRLLPADLP